MVEGEKDHGERKRRDQREGRHILNLIQLGECMVVQVGRGGGQRGLNSKKAQASNPPPPPTLRLQNKHIRSVKVTNFHKCLVEENNKILAWPSHGLAT